MTTRAMIPHSLERLVQLRRQADRTPSAAHYLADKRYADELTYRTALLADDFDALRVVLDAAARELAAHDAH